MTTISARLAGTSSMDATSIGRRTFSGTVSEFQSPVETIFPLAIEERRRDLDVIEIAIAAPEVLELVEHAWRPEAGDEPDSVDLEEAVPLGVADLDAGGRSGLRHRHGLGREVSMIVSVTVVVPAATVTVSPASEEPQPTSAMPSICTASPRTTTPIACLTVDRC